MHLHRYLVMAAFAADSASGYSSIFELKAMLRADRINSSVLLDRLSNAGRHHSAHSTRLGLLYLNHSEVKVVLRKRWRHC